MFDNRLTVHRAGEIAHWKSRGDLKAFHAVTSKDGKKIYPTSRLTRLFKKMVLGVRRHFLGDAWTFVPRESVQLFTVMRERGIRTIYALPVKVGSNKGFTLPANYEDTLDNIEYQQFRDFRFARDESTIVIRFARVDHGEEFVLVANVEPDQETADGE
jgi:hypothetical protein